MNRKQFYAIAYPLCEIVRISERFGIFAAEV